MRPRDECPYNRPFPADFDACEAFLPVRFMPVNIDDRPLAPVRTCRHLVSRRTPGEGARWYAACELGDAPARHAWVQAVDPRRLAAIGTLRHEMADMNANFIDELWVLKNQQLEVRRSRGETSPVDRQMRELGQRFIEQTQAFLEARLVLLQEIDVTADAIVQLLRLSLDHLITSSSRDVRWEVPDEALAQFSPPVRLFFRPPPTEVRSTAGVE